MHLHRRPYGFVTGIGIRDYTFLVAPFGFVTGTGIHAYTFLVAPNGFVAGEVLTGCNVPPDPEKKQMDILARMILSINAGTEEQDVKDLQEMINNSKHMIVACIMQFRYMLYLWWIAVMSKHYQ